MTRRILISPRASFDLDDHFAYIAENNFDAAVRFFGSARQTFAKIAQTPGIGKLCEVENPRLAGLRKWAVKGFENYLIFYLDDGEMSKLCGYSTLQAISQRFWKWKNKSTIALSNPTSTIAPTSIAKAIALTHLNLLVGAGLADMSRGKQITYKQNLP